VWVARYSLCSPAVGLRIGEALAVRWQHADVGTGTLYVVDAKTPKGVREMHLTPALREGLALWRTEAKRTGRRSS
jgi:integrase